MKKQMIAIDINALNTDQLQCLADMMYYSNYLTDTGSLAENLEIVNRINLRIAFLEGWMSEKQEAEYVAKYCE